MFSRKYPWQEIEQTWNNIERKHIASFLPSLHRLWFLWDFMKVDSASVRNMSGSGLKTIWPRCMKPKLYPRLCKARLVSLSLSSFLPPSIALQTKVGEWPRDAKSLKKNISVILCSWSGSSLWIHALRLEPGESAIRFTCGFVWKWSSNIILMRNIGFQEFFTDQSQLEVANVARLE